MINNSFNPTQFTKKVLIVFAVFSIGILLLLLLGETLPILLLLFASILFGVFILGLARLLSGKTKISQTLAVWLVIIVIVILTAGINYFIGHRISEQFTQLSESLTQAVKDVEETISNNKFLKQVSDQVDVKEIMSGKDSNITSSIFGVFSSVLGVIGGLFIFIALSLFIATDPKTYVTGILSLFSKEKQPRANEVLDSLSNTLFRWLSGRIIDMIIVGVATGIGLWILGIPLALSLGILTAILSFIPNLGPILAIIPPALLAFTQGGNMVLYVVILFVGVQLLESYLLTPYIQKKAVRIPPVLLLVAQLVFAKFGGILGLLLATPITAVLMVLVKMLYIKDVLKQEIAK